MKKTVTLTLIFLLALSFMGSAMADDGPFARIGGNTFSFMSGAGGWSTDVTISEDGSFTGYFYDADMGDIGDGYPDGTLYSCRFFGTFAVTGKIDEYTYELRLTALDTEEEAGAERIEDGVRIITSDAYGIDGGETFMLYFPGRKTADLPEQFLDWVGMPNVWEEIPATLPFFGLYNVLEETGFFAYAEEGLGDAPYESSELSGAWQTLEEDGSFITLLLYPGDAFRLSQYNIEDEETLMLEGTRTIQGNTIVVSDIRLGKLDAGGNYSQTGESDAMRFQFSLDLGGTTTLTLISEQGDAIDLYPVDLDAPG